MVGIEKVYRQDDIDKNVDEALGDINELNVTNRISYAVYLELFDIIANIANVNTYLVRKEEIENDAK